MRQPTAAGSSDIERLLEHLRSADIWVRNRGYQALIGHSEVARALEGKRTVDLPHTQFRAFHPDCIQPYSRQTGRPVAPFQSSLIVAWSYQKRLAPERVRRLFNRDVFCDLGYLDLWDAGVERLRRSFDACGLDFSTFFLKVKRAGIFMHTPAHPAIDFLFTLAKTVALKLEQDVSILQNSTVLADGLAQGAYWPVYPEIGDALSVPSSKTWRIDSNTYYDLNSFIAFSYESYSQQGVEPPDLDLNIAPKQLADVDETLNSWSLRL